jgi:hypothetical protein
VSRRDAAFGTDETLAQCFFVISTVKFPKCLAPRRIVGALSSLEVFPIPESAMRIDGLLEAPSINQVGEADGRGYFFTAGDGFNFTNDISGSFPASHRAVMRSVVTSSTAVSARRTTS